MSTQNKEAEKSVVRMNPSSATQKTIKKNIDIFLYAGIGINMTMLLLYNFIPQLTGFIFCFTLTIFTTTLALNKRREKQ